MPELKKNQIVYYTRIIPSSGIYDILELKLRTVESNWYVGCEKRDKQAYLFYVSDIGKTIFVDRDEALVRVQEAESHKKYVSDETDYEEY